MTEFLANQWYAAGWSDGLVAHKPLARAILGRPLVIWRSGTGAVSALADACPHRLAPLSAGQVDGGAIRCGYHGLAFDGSGRCIANPHGPLLDSLRVRAFPLVERHEMLWVWMGSVEGADPALIPDLGFIDQARPTAISRGYMFTRAGHKLLEDNILDLSHADYLHPDSLGGGSITRSRANVEERGDTVFVQWLSTGEPAIPVFRPLMRDPDGPADMWTEVLWHPNGVMVLHVAASEPGGTPATGIDTWNAHIMTPEGPTTTHYFYVNSRNYRVDDAEYNQGLAAGLKHAFETEDKPMIEAQQRSLGDRDLFDSAPKLLRIDDGSTRARRTYQRLLAAERQLYPATDPVATHA